MCRIVIDVAAWAGLVGALASGSWNARIRALPDGRVDILQTVTTIGYGDVTPTVPIGRLVGRIVMLLAIASLAS